MSVDVLIPTRDRSHLTEEAVESLLRQTCSDWRAVIVDDGSRAEEAERLASLAARDTRLSVIRANESGGPQAARQLGFASTDGDWVALLDSDDLWEPTKLERQLEVVGASRRVEVILTGYAWLQSGRRGDPKVPNQPTPEASLITDNMSCPLIRRDTLIRAGGLLPSFVRTPLPATEHIEFWLRVMAASTEIAIVPEVLTLCRTHGGHRESDALHSLESAEALHYTISLHSPYLQRHPGDHARLLARLGARYLDAGRKLDGIRNLGKALQVAPGNLRGDLLRRYAPFLVKSVVHRA